MLLNLLVLVLIITVVAFPSSILRIVLGVPFLIFFPGYVLQAALFPKRDERDLVERVALSIGLSLAVIPLIAIALDYSPFDIRLTSLLLSVTGFILVTSGVAWFRRRKLALPEQAGVAFRVKASEWFSSTWEKSLSIILVLSILGAVTTAGYVIAGPNREQEKFTEFYLLNLAGRTESFPGRVKQGEEVQAVIVIVNRENEALVYRVEINIDEIRVNKIGPFMLGSQQLCEYKVSFVPLKTGPDQKVEFLLFKGEESQPYERLHLWVDVES